MRAPDYTDEVSKSDCEDLGKPFESPGAFAAATPAGRLLGLDLGRRTIGVAVSDSYREIALSVGTLKVDRPAAGFERLGAIVGEREATGLVVGLPVSLDGRSNPRAQGIRRVAGNLQRTLGLPVLLWDERLSTVAVERAMIGADISRARRRAGVDAEAAAWILQGALGAIATSCDPEAT